MGYTKLLWIDTETTGLDPNRNGIVSIAGIIDNNGTVERSFQFEMRPTGRFAEDSALEINGYTKAKIKKLTPWEKVLPEFLHEISGPDKLTLAGQNVKFDNKFVRSWFGPNVEYWDLMVDQSAPVDTLEIAKKLDYLPSRKLGDLCDIFGVRLDNAHNAMADIKATRELYYVMVDKLEGAKQNELRY